MWHGKELSAGTSATTQEFQLWVALPPDLEHAEPEARYIGAERMPSIGSARLIVGAYKGITSPVSAPGTINYLLVTLRPGERWTYEAPFGHLTGWVAIAKGERLSKGELVIFEQSETPITFENADGVGATFVLGSAVPHPYPLHLGAYSVHTSAQRWRRANATSVNSKTGWMGAATARTGSGSTPVFRG